MSRKGIGMIIVWLFIMIAGAAILLLFSLIAKVQSDNIQEQLAVDALSRLRSILTTQQATGDLSLEIDVPDREISFNCELIEDNFVVSDIRIGGIPETATNALYAGDDFSSPKLLVFSKTLRLPYEIGSILFISGDDEILVLEKSSNSPMDKSDAIYKTINNTLIKGYNLRVLDEQPDDLWDPDFFDNARIMVFGPGDMEGIFDNLKRKSSWSITQVKPANDDDPFRQGQITYWACSNNCVEKGSLNYAGVEMLLAYAWMGDYDKARCFEQKLKNEYSRITQVQIRRIEQLRDVYSQNIGISNINLRLETCRDLYTTTKLEAAKQEVMDNGFSNDFLTNLNDIRLKNEQLIRGVKCASIY